MPDVFPCPGDNGGPGQENRLNWFWRCIDPDANQGLPGRVDLCQPGCIPCNDEPNGLVGMSGDAHCTRWLRPHPTFNSRDSLGRLGPLRANVPALVPLTYSRERAPCYYQDERECYTDDTCDCEDVPPVVPHVSGTCDDGTPTGQPLRGILKDCTSFDLTLWTSNSAQEMFRCREMTEIGTLPITMRSRFGDWGIPIFHSLTKCNQNMLLPCTGLVEASPCEGAHGQELSGDRAYWENACRIHLYNVFSLFQAAGQSMPHIKYDAALMPFADPRIIDVKNRALAMVLNPSMRFKSGPSAANFTTFDRIDLEVDLVGNGRLGWWTRTWDGPALVEQGRITKNDFPTLLTMPGCYMRQAGCPVQIDLKVNYAQVSAYFYANNVETRTPLAHKVYPYVKLRVTAGITAVARPFGSPCVLNKPWVEGPEANVTLSINNSADGRSYPTVSPLHEDHIVYVHPTIAGRGAFVPPVLATWKGSLGQTTLPVAGNIWNGDTTFDIHEGCRRLSKGFREQDVIVRGERTHRDTQDQDLTHAIYGGALQVFSPVTGGTGCDI